MGLSQRRAEAVRDYLVSRGVDVERMTAKGYGMTQPVADNKTKAGRARNRRVVMYATENPGDVKVEGQGTAQ
jgi:OOP family OmpA-OmpF porin